MFGLTHINVARRDNVSDEMTACFSKITYYMAFSVLFNMVSCYHLPYVQMAHQRQERDAWHNISAQRHGICCDST